MHLKEVDDVRRVKNAYNRLKRACAAVRRWYEATIEFVTRRIVLFPALGVAVFTAILVAVIVGTKLSQVIAVFVTTVAILTAMHVLRGRDSDAEAIFTASPAPKMASKRVSKMMHPDPKVEQFEWEGREHLISLIDVRPGWQWFVRGIESWAYWRFWFPGLCSFVILAIGFAVTHNVLAALVLLLLVGLGLRIAEWHRRYLAFTTIRFMALRGVATTRKLQVPLEAMTGHSIQVPWHSKILKFLGIIKACYGTLLISVPGEHNAELNETPWMPDINSIDLHLTDLIYTRKESLKGGFKQAE